MSKDKWFSKMDCGRLSLEERGLLATLWNWGDIVHIAWDEVDAILGKGWMPIARKLCKSGRIYYGYNRGWVILKINIPNEKRMEQMRIAQRAYRLRQKAKEQAKTM